MERLFLCAAGLSALAAASPANARPEYVTQVSPPHRVSQFGLFDPARRLDWTRRGAHGAAVESYSAALQFARCVARLDGEAPGRLLKTPMGRDDDRSALFDLARQQRGCAGQMAAVSPILLRAALAESTLRQHRTGSRGEPQTAVGIPAEVQGFPLMRVARCQLAYAPDMVWKLLGTQPGGAGERAAAEALFGSVPQCSAGGLGGIHPTVARLALVDAAFQAR